MASTRFTAMRVIFTICNVFFLVMGVAMICVGGYLQVSRSDYINLLPSDEFFTATALLICSGTIVVVVSLFGFFGVWMKSQCIMFIYFLCVLVILCLAIAAGIIAFIFRGRGEFDLQSKLLEGLRDTEKKTEWDALQTKERCCGVNNYTDWYGVIAKDSITIPDSCCDGPNCGIQGGIVAYNEGCYKKGQEWIQDNFYTLGAAGLVLGILQIILLVASLALIMMMRREKDMV